MKMMGLGWRGYSGKTMAMVFSKDEVFIVKGHRIEIGNPELKIYQHTSTSYDIPVFGETNN